MVNNSDNPSFTYDLAQSNRFACGAVFTLIIIYMKKLLDSDWIRAMRFKCNNGAKMIYNTSANYTS